MDGILDRARLDQRQRRRAARHGLKRRRQPDQRLLAGGEPLALLGLEGLEQSDPPLGRGQARFGGLQPRRERLGFGARALGGTGRAPRLAIELAIARLGLARLALGLLERLGVDPRRMRAVAAGDQQQGRRKKKRRLAFP